MARPLRLEVPGGLYHVIVRGNERKPVFRDDRDREWYLARLAHYREKLGFRLLAYCLMDNHVHLAIETGQAPLSRIMAALQSSYTQYFNRRHGRVGHLFQGRYKAFLVEEDRYALALVRYIHENALKARLVGRVEDYPWSSDRFYRRGRAPEWLDVDRVLGMLGRRRSTAVREYRRLMRETREESYESVATWGQAVRGDEAFADRVLKAAGEPAIVPRGLTVERIARQAAELGAVPLSEATGIGRGRRQSEVRLLTAWASREVARISVARVAKYFSRDASTLAKGLVRLEERMEKDRDLRRTANRLAAALRPGQ
jgi:REP element-mobilizing transposase RayT